MGMVFVYGTLLEGERNHAVLAGARKIGDGFIDGAKMWIPDHGWFPYVVIDEKGGRVVGEVFAVDEETERRLDVLEGVPRHYGRVRRFAEVGGKRIAVDVFAVERAPMFSRVEDSGSWRAFRARILASEEK